MKKRKLTVYEAPGCGSKSLPCIRLQGKWLEELGFLKGCSFVVEEEKGKLLIELVKETPEEYTRVKR